LKAAEAPSKTFAEEAALPPDPPPAPPPPPDSQPAADAAAVAAPMAAPAPLAVAGGAPAEPAPTTATQAAEVNGEMLDIEARVSLQVPKVKSALRQLRELTEQAHGVVTEERVDTASASGTAQVTLRVPSGKAKGLLDRLDAIGNVLSQSVEAKDIGKEYFDAKLRLSSLEVTLRRYQEILTRATSVEEVLRIEQELSRLRAEIEQVKGNLRWLSDRAARATLHVALHERAPEIAEAVAEPEAKFFPGVRLPVLVDFGRGAGRGYVGGGLSLRFSRAVSLDLDILKHPGSAKRGPDALVATLGGELYSERLGDGERRFLNPYLGWRAGYVEFDGDHQALLGATLGVELYKNRWFGLDAEARNYVAFIGARGAHYLLSPALSAQIAF
jgi:hypothetical protein